MTTSATNASMSAAKSAKNDEFYTVWASIEAEMNAYLDFNPDVFRGKTVLCPCDDPEWSNFAKFFALHFTDFGIKRLISTSYAPDSNPAGQYYAPTLFETEDPKFDLVKTRSRGKKFILDPTDISGDGKIDLDDLTWDYLDGDGDFRSAEVTTLRDESDIVVTNPPFSLFREFLAWLVDGSVLFSAIGNSNAATYRNVFPLIKNNQIWKGATANESDMVFGVPKGFPVKKSDRDKAERLGYPPDEHFDYTRLGNSCWFTNIEHGRRHRSMQLMSMDDNLKFNKRLRTRLGGHEGYFHYDNFDAIEVPFNDAIPSRYDGIMGVPITFLDKYNPDVFEIIGTNRYTIPHGMSQKFVDDYYASGQKGQIHEGHPDLCYYDAHNRPVVTYDRILIRYRKDRT